MSNERGFLIYKRKDHKYRPVKERLKDFKDVALHLNKENINKQAARCIDCGIPFCHSLGCPVDNLVPEFNELVYEGKWNQALRRLLNKNPLPEITGRICPAPCEDACTLSINDEPVNIKELELAIIEEGFKEGYVEPDIPEKEINSSVAIIGSGPAGLAAAIVLRKAGFKVTVFEKSDSPGGILRYGIPDFKLEKNILDRRIDIMKKSGIKFENSVEAGKDISAKLLKQNFDNIILAVGAEEPRDLRIPGRDLDGIYFAMDYLTAVNRKVKGVSHKKIEADGKNVLVIGGGDTGSDCVGTANREGANKVYQVEIMPRPEKNENKFNPDWPNINRYFKSTTSHEEGVERMWNISTKAFKGENGKVKEAEFVKVKWDKDNSGKFSPVEVENSGFSLDVDMVLIAMGFLHTKQSALIKDLNINTDDRGNLKTDKDLKTESDSVYAAGDSVSGASLVVNAIKSGVEAAAGIIKNIEKD